MKSKLIIAGLIIIAAVMLPSLSSVMATVQSPPLTVSQQLVVWTIDLQKPISFGVSGKDATRIEAQYFIMVPNPDPSGIPPYVPKYFDITILKFSLADSQIKLWLDPSDPIFSTTGVVDGSYVIVTFAGLADAITFSGPGWTHGNVG
jgi:hypothetical protein